MGETKPEIKKSFKGWKVAVIGAATEGLAVARFLREKGAKVTICDQKDKLSVELDPRYRWRLGRNYLKKLENFDVVFRSPGVRYLLPEIQQAKKKGVEISSQTKLFFELCPCKIIGITGTKGKGTTATLIYEILKSSLGGRSSVYLAGNIGKPAIDLLDKLKPEDIVVLELSSFQLQDFEKSPHIAVVLNITSDHLDYHKDRNEYIEAKMPITKFQTAKDFLVVNVDYEVSRSFREKTEAQVYEFSRYGKVERGCFVENGLVFWKDQRKVIPVARTAALTLRGEHNWENVCAAVAASILAGADPENIGSVVERFPGLEHRLEFVAEIDNVKYYNDSFSTTPETAIAAIRAFPERKILILGGSDKGSDFGELGREIVHSNVKAVILVGQTAGKIKTAIVDQLQTKKSRLRFFEGCRNMKEIVKVADSEAEAGDVVLLSPACASFGMFRDYKDRGEQFKKEVKNLVSINKQLTHV